MAIILHVFIALASLIYSGFILFFPSKGRIFFSYVLINATILSGTFLILTMPAHMVQSCITGLFYLGAVAVMTVFAHKKLAAERNDTSNG